MARRRKAAPKRTSKSNGHDHAPAAVATSSPGPAVKVIAESAFKNLCNQIRNAQRDADEARGAIGGLITQACESKHLHKKAFAIYRALNKLSDAHLMTTLTHFDHYREIGGLDERATRQSEMLADRPEVNRAGAQLAEFNGRRTHADEFEIQMEPETA